MELTVYGSSRALPLQLWGEIANRIYCLEVLLLLLFGTFCQIPVDFMFLGYWPQPGQIRNCQLSVAASSLNCPLPMSLAFLLCTLLRGCFVLLLKSHPWILCIPHVKIKTVGQLSLFYFAVFFQWNSLPSDIDCIQYIICMLDMIF